MRLVACLGLCLLLSGCSDLSGMFSSDSNADDDTVQTEAAADPAPVAAPAAAPAPRDDSFCRNVAANDANSYGYDQATQARVAQQSFAQCQATFTR